MVRLHRSTLPFVGVGRARALVADAGVEQRRPQEPAAVADPVVGQHPGHGDAVHGEPAVGRRQHRAQVWARSSPRIST
jgi:hypothetical protein